MPAIPYFTADRVRVPSVTTVIKHVDGDAEGLIRWAWKMGKEGVTLEQARAHAAGVGTIVHAAIEADLKGEEIDLSDVNSEMRKQVDAAMGAWKLWWDTAHVGKILATEMSLVSEPLRYGGTLDAIMEVSGKRTLFDFKTGKGLYAKDLAQAAGYGILWNENNPDFQIERYSLLRLGKDDGAFSWVHMEPISMEPAFLSFRAALELYDLSKTLKKMV
jgi:hypothetical protein